MRNALKASLLFILLVVIIAGVDVFPGAKTNAAPSAPWQSKVDAWVLETGASGETEFLVFLAEQADLSGAEGLKTKLEKGAFVYQQLMEVAARTQPPVLAALKTQGVEYKPYWVANMIWVRGGLQAVQAMSQRGDVAHVYANPSVKIDLPAPDLSNASPAAPQGIEWNILKVKADDVWAAGYTGQGAVIGGQDTGYEWDHPALKNQYRGWDGVSADHNYSWHDAIYSGGGACGPLSPEPCDDYGHGTHTMGTMVGDDGGSNQIGMAPGARWIGCRNMSVGVGTPTTYAECYQWFIAPTDLKNQNPDPSKAPDVIDNSWGCTVDEGCSDPNVLLSVVNAVRAAGILTAHSAGNDGYDGCYTIDEPAAIYDASYTVGATDSSDNIAYFSSRGSVTIDGSGRLKPDISAPGVSVRSSVPGGGYNYLSGTSMAAPHVAGLVALLISSNPSLAGQVSVLEYIVNHSALPRPSSQTCGGVPGSQIPNNTYGHGRIDALAALLDHSFLISKSTPVAEVYPGGTITYTIAITHVNPAYPTANVVLTDTLPVGTSFVSATQPYSFDGSTVRWDIASLEAMESKSVELVVQVAPSARGTIVNDSYAVRSDDASGMTGDPLSVDILALSQVLSKTAPESVAPGAILTYTLTVTNPYSNITIHNLVLTDTIPANTSFITATLPYSLLGDLVRWNFASLASSQSRSVELSVQSPLNGKITNQDYGAAADETDHALGGKVQTAVLSDTLTLDKTAPATIQAGGEILYNLTVANPRQLAPGTNLVLTDTLPANTEFVTATLPANVSGDLITWTLDELPAGKTWSVQLVVRVPLVFAGTVVNDQYGVRSDEVEPVYGLPVTTQVHSLALDKTAEPDLADIGDLITYTLAITNQNPVSSTHNIILVDTLPAGTAFISATQPNSFDPSAGVITWTIPSLSPGESLVFSLTVEVLPGAFGAIVNKDYSAASAETPEPLFGEPVSTRLQAYIFLPLIFKNLGG